MTKSITFYLFKNKTAVTANIILISKSCIYTAYILQNMTAPQLYKIYIYLQSN